MSNFFRLNAHCHFVKGDDEGCIYNLLDGTMIIIKQPMVGYIEMCENNMLIKDIPEIVADFLDSLEELGLGNYYEEATYIDKLSAGIPEAFEKSVPSNRKVETVFIEIASDCNFNCIFCSENEKVLYRRTGCKRWPLKNSIVGINEWKDVIDQVSKLSCRHIVFMGGEPLLNVDLLEELCAYIREKGINKISIYTNGSILNDNIVMILKEYNIRLKVQLLAFSDELYEKITGVSNIGSTVLGNMKQLVKNKINLCLSYLVLRHNENEINQAIQTYTQFVESPMEFEFVYPIPDNDYYSEKYLSTMYDQRKRLQGTGLNVHKFCDAQKQHNCYGHQIGITADGCVLPCIMSRDFFLGDIRKNKIHEIINNKRYDFYRQLNKDKVKKCKLCALKYGCFDCRALEYSATGDVYGLEYCEVSRGKDLRVDAG